MTSFLVVEGPDGVGKSTLARKVAAEYGATYMHVGPPISRDSAFDELVRLIAMGWTHSRVVFDRFHFGNYAYGSEFRGGPDLSWPEMLTIEAMLQVRDHAAVILCGANQSVREQILGSKSLGDGQAKMYESDFAKQDRIVALMSEAANRSTLPVFRQELISDDWLMLGNTTYSSVGEMDGAIDFLGWREG